MKVTVKVPASTANLGPGFDTIGMAFSLYTVITMEIAEKTTISLLGDHLSQLPTDESNLVYEVAADLFRSLEQPVPPLAITISSEIPLTRGLGSSAAAIVGGLVAANVLMDLPYTMDELFSHAARLEGHPDNVGASCFGGVIVSTMPNDDVEEVPYVHLPIPSSLRVLAVVPQFELKTTAAREVLPTTYAKQDAIYTIGHSSLLVAALAQNRLDLFAEAVQDKLHQPYRARLVPGLAEILTDATSHGALAATLSGAGPTSLCFYQTEQQRTSLVHFLDDVMSTHQVGYELLDLEPDQLGMEWTIEK
jgi:homoserine kinase